MIFEKNYRDSIHNDFKYISKNSSILESNKRSKILVIEDDKPIRDNIFEILDFEDFEVLRAANGLIGVELAIKEIPDLIISDIMMPELDGYGVLNILRNNPITANIPFIFITAKADKVFMRQGLQLGANSYVTKPFTCEELLTAIQELLPKK